MREYDRVAPRPGSGPVGRGIGSRCLAAIGVAILLAAGCSPAASPSPAATPASGGPAGTPATTAAQGLAAATPAPAVTPAASPMPAYADTLRIGWDPSPGSAFYGFRDALEGQDPRQLNLGTVVFGGLYRYDAAYEAVPDLADGPCLPQADPKVIRCHLIETTFHDGTPVTADDVAYSYRLWQTCGWFDLGEVTDVRVIDPRTVDFIFASVDSSFFSSGLATPILPRHAVEADYTAFVTAMKGHTAAELTKLADAIDAGTSQDPPVCAPHLDEAASVIARLGVPLYREDFSRDGTFDTCGWVGTASWLIRAAADSLGTTGLAAVAAAVPDLRVDWQPIGTGPYRFVSGDANGIHVEAWPGYHGGMAATATSTSSRRRATGRTSSTAASTSLSSAGPTSSSPSDPPSRRPPPRTASGSRCCRSPGTTPSSTTCGPGACSPTPTSAGPSSSASTCRARSTP